MNNTEIMKKYGIYFETLNRWKKSGYKVNECDIRDNGFTRSRDADFNGESIRGYKKRDVSKWRI